MNTKILLFSLILLTLIHSQPCCSSNTFHVSANGKVSLLPDFASIKIGVESQMNTTSAALTYVNQQIATLIKTIQNQGINPNDYTTSSFSITPVYNYSSGVSVMIGQKVSQIFTVKIKNMANNGLAVGNLITAASKINGIVINSVNFDQFDHTLGAQLARKAAFNTAKSKADQYALLSNITLKKLNRIEALDYGTFTPFYVSGSSFESNWNLLVPSRNVTVTANVDLWYSF